MNRIKYAEQLYALISMCLGCAFIVFGLLSFIGIHKRKTSPADLLLQNLQCLWKEPLHPAPD